MPSVGIDLIEIERVERALARRPRLAERLFTDAERAYAATRARPGQHLAARFAAKEAVLKALALPVMRPREIEVVPGEHGAPAVVLHGTTSREAAGARVSLSLTHTRTTAGAVAVRA
jgi:holo-[acyl-carrier protein] synthase